jgi:hypothetical protein
VRMFRASRRPTTITVTTPATTSDVYGNETLTYDTNEGATTSTRTVHLHPTLVEEATGRADREAFIREADVYDRVGGFDGVELVTWNGRTYKVLGPSRAFPDLRGRIRFYVTALRVVAG